MSTIGGPVRVLCDTVIRVSRETRSATQRSIRGLRGCEEALNTRRREVRARPFGDSSVHTIPQGSGALLRYWSAIFQPMTRNKYPAASQHV